MATSEEAKRRAAEARRERQGAPGREFKAALQAEERTTPLIQPSEDEKRNGWTAETLTAYVQEQRASQSLRVDPMSAMNRQARRPQRQNRNYRPLRWRG